MILFRQSSSVFSERRKPGNNMILLRQPWLAESKWRPNTHDLLRQSPRWLKREVAPEQYDSFHASRHLCLARVSGAREQYDYFTPVVICGFEGEQVAPGNNMRFFYASRHLWLSGRRRPGTI
ncbi:hypothetical protein AVEN_135731-1 [Araneus ventricosus]|uniref:Uncharacterized protein n=1 Tax=Araneus ventricosus TaxID=182803 RepID=A0A4Y2WD85_ARAVE|nr:hypothetical protein AVEN_135731-1 [Araneus ventricosus]